MMGAPPAFTLQPQCQQPPQMAMFGPSVPPTITVPQQPANKKRKSPNQGAMQQPWTQQAQGGTQPPPMWSGPPQQKATPWQQQPQQQMGGQGGQQMGPTHYNTRKHF